MPAGIDRAGIDRTRADIGFADALDGFDTADWVPPPAPKPRQPAGAAQAPAPTPPPAAAAIPAKVPRPAAQFAPPLPAAVTPEAVAERHLVRRRRTGRNVQFNFKARPETIEAYCAIADAMGWGLAETLEYAVALLQREYTAGR